MGNGHSKFFKKPKSYCYRLQVPLKEIEPHSFRPRQELPDPYLALRPPCEIWPVPSDSPLGTYVAHSSPASIITSSPCRQGILPKTNQRIKICPHKEINQCSALRQVAGGPGRRNQVPNQVHSMGI